MKLFSIFKKSVTVKRFDFYLVFFQWYLMPTTSSRVSCITHHTLVKALHANVEHARIGFNSILHTCISYYIEGLPSWPCAGLPPRHGGGHRQKRWHWSPRSSGVCAERPRQRGWTLWLLDPFPSFSRQPPNYMCIKWQVVSTL